MNKFDFVIILIVLIFMVLGYYKGLVKSILSVVQYFAVIFLSIYFSPMLSEVLIENFGLDSTIINWVKNNENLFSDTISLISEEILKNITGRIINVLAFISLFIILKLLFSIIIAILNKVANLPILKMVNRTGGLFIGVINGILVVYLGILIINWLPLDYLNNIKLELNSSILGAGINSFVPEIASEVGNLVDVAVLTEKE